MTATVDCNSGHFTEEIVSWDGPYDTEEEALQGGRDAAIEWCINNQVRWK